MERNKNKWAAKINESILIEKKNIWEMNGKWSKSFHPMVKKKILVNLKSLKIKNFPYL